MMLQRYNKKARLQNSLAFFCCFFFNIGFDGFNGFFLCFKPQTTQKDAKLYIIDAIVIYYFCVFCVFCGFFINNEFHELHKYSCSSCNPLTKKLRCQNTRLRH